MILPCSNAVAALTFSNYVLKPFYDGCEPPSSAIRMMAFAIVLILVWVNCRSVDWSMRLQNSFTLAKVLALVLIIAVGFYYLATNRTELITQNGFWRYDQLTISGFGSAFYQGFYSFAGWNCLNFVTEEIKNPVKNMPRAIILSMTIVTAIYILANVAYFVVLTPQQITESAAIAVVFGKTALGAFSFIMPLAVALSTTSGLNALIFSSSRILFVGARQGQLFSALEMISMKHLTPVPSLIIVGFMSCLYLTTTHMSALIDYLIIVEAGFATLAVSTVIVLRRKMPEIERPLQVHLSIPATYLIVSCMLLMSPMLEKPITMITGLIILLSGIPVYYLTANWDPKPATYQKLVDRVTRLTQRLTMSVVPDKEV